MSKTTDPIILTAELIQRRDDVRTLLAEHYIPDVMEAILALRGAASMWNVPMAEAALRIGKEMDARGVDPSIVFAALVEECEGKTE